MRVQVVARELITLMALLAAAAGVYTPKNTHTVQMTDLHCGQRLYGFGSFLAISIALWNEGRSRVLDDMALSLTHVDDRAGQVR